MTYARQRLWLGITGVGTTVVIAFAALLFDLPHRLMPRLADQSFTTALASVAGVWMLHAAVLAPLDFLGGAIVVPGERAPLRWLAGWLRGVLVQWLWFALAAGLLLRTAQQFGRTGALLVFLLLQVVLLSRQGLLAWLVGGVRLRTPSDTLRAAGEAAGIPATMLREVDSDDPAFVGGWTGTAAQHLWVPQHWVRSLSASQLAVALTRRVAVRSAGLRRRGVLVALAWNSAGFVLATAAPRADLLTAAGFVTVMAWFTVWSFVGVLVLPSQSRPAVFAADAAAAAVHSPALVAATISQLDRWQDDEAERSPGVERIFHPVPVRGSRLRALESGHAAGVDPAPAAWHSTRMMLFLGWAGLSGLSRAVHCNIGRPALWVLFPGD